MRLLVSILLATMAAAGSQKTGPVEIRRSAEIGSGEREAALGRAMAADVEKRYRPLEDAAALERVDRIVHALGQQAALPFPVAVSLLQSPQAFAGVFPGGFLLLSSGLLYGTTDTELAGVLAHAIGHMSIFHDAPRPQPGKARYIVSMDGLCMRFGTNLVVPKAYEQQARDSEVKADALAAGYLANAGFAAQPLPELFAKLRKVQQPANSKRPTLRRPGEHQ